MSERGVTPIKLRGGPLDGEARSVTVDPMAAPKLRGAEPSVVIYRLLRQPDGSYHGVYFSPEERAAEAAWLAEMDALDNPL